VEDVKVILMHIDVSTAKASNSTPIRMDRRGGNVGECRRLDHFPAQQFNGRNLQTTRKIVWKSRRPVALALDEVEA
jgi:hypothetical protein